MLLITMHCPKYVFLTRVFGCSIVLIFFLSGFNIFKLGHAVVVMLAAKDFIYKTKYNVTTINISYINKETDFKTLTYNFVAIFRRILKYSRHILLLPNRQFICIQIEETRSIKTPNIIFIRFLYPTTSPVQ